MNTKFRLKEFISLLHLYIVTKENSFVFIALINFN